MDQEQLIRQIMSEVMKSLGNDSVSFAKNAPAPAAPAQAPPRGPAGSAATSTRWPRNTRSW